MQDGLSDVRIPAPQLARRYSITSRTLDRWLEKESLHFPKPFVVNGRRYWPLATIENWERERAVASASARAAAAA